MSIHIVDGVEVTPEVVAPVVETVVTPEIVVEEVVTPVDEVVPVDTPVITE